MNAYVARPGRSLRDALRELRAVFGVTPGPPRTETREYLDTFDWRLFRAGLLLARIGDRLVLADVASRELAAQGAWHRAAPPRFAGELPTDDLRRFVATVTEPRALLPVARARVATRAIEVRNAAGRPVAAVRFESAVVRHGQRARRVNGMVADAPVGGSARGARTGVSAALARAGFRPAQAGWFETLLRAAGCKPGEYSTRPQVKVAPDGPARVVVAEILRSLQDVMRLNEAGIRDDTDIEFLHDFRVALRRTRAGVTELKGVLPADAAHEFRTRLRALAEPTGRLRDLDVLLARRASYLGRLPEDFRSGLDTVFAAMERERASARDELRAVLAGREYAVLMDDWQRALDALAQGRAVGIDAEAPALEVGRRAIAKRYERLREIASTPEALDDASLHRARLHGKKLRYLIEFFQDGLGRKADSLLSHMESAQDALGEFNDLGVQARVFRGALGELSGDHRDACARAAALGGIVALLEARRRKMRRRCEHCLHALREPLPPGLA